MADQELSELIEERLPYDGPHSTETVLEAGMALRQLVRYLNNATQAGNARNTLTWAPTIYRLSGAVGATVWGLDQLLDQLAVALENHAENSWSLYDDRRDRPGSVTALEAAQVLREARGRLPRDLMNEASEITAHLGHDD